MDTSFQRILADHYRRHLSCFINWYVSFTLCMAIKVKWLTQLAFNVFIAKAMITELISFAIPAAFLMWRRRAAKYLPQGSAFNLGKAGWLVNSLVIARAILAIIIFCIPTVKPITAGNMSKSSEVLTCNIDWSFSSDYTLAVLGAMILLALLNWLFFARKHYLGPSLTLLVDN